MLATSVFLFRRTFHFDPFIKRENDHLEIDLKSLAAGKIFLVYKKARGLLSVPWSEPYNTEQTDVYGWWGLLLLETIAMEIFRSKWMCSVLNWHSVTKHVCFFLSESVKLGLKAPSLLKSPLLLMNAYRLGRKKDNLQAEGYPAITPSIAIMGSKKRLLRITCSWILLCNLPVGE